MISAQSGGSGMLKRFEGPQSQSQSEVGDPQSRSEPIRLAQRPHDLSTIPDSPDWAGHMVMCGSGPPSTSLLWQSRAWVVLVHSPGELRPPTAVPWRSRHFVVAFLGPLVVLRVFLRAPEARAPFQTLCLIFECQPMAAGGSLWL